MSKKILLPFFLMLLLTNIAHGEDSLLGGIAKGIATGMAQEAGKRLMSTIIDGTSSGIEGDEKRVKVRWERNRPHPVYNHVISTETRGEWKPENGYVWQNFQDGNDWSVVRVRYYKKNNSRSNNTFYRVVYSGKDGVNVRSTPNGKQILAAAYNQSTIPFKYLSSNPNGNRNWKKFKITGWMVKKSKRRHKEYLVVNLDNIATIIWDGDGNPRDNFVNLRTTTNFKSNNIVARVYTNTSVRVTGRKMIKNREWVNVELIGWMLIKTSRGKQLLNLVN